MVPPLHEDQPRLSSHSCAHGSILGPKETGVALGGKQSLCGGCCPLSRTNRRRDPRPPSSAPRRAARCAHPAYAVRVRLGRGSGHCSSAPAHPDPIRCENTSQAPACYNDHHALLFPPRSDAQGPAQPLPASPGCAWPIVASSPQPGPARPRGFGSPSSSDLPVAGTKCTSPGVLIACAHSPLAFA